MRSRANETLVWFVKQAEAGGHTSVEVLPEDDESIGSLFQQLHRERTKLGLKNRVRIVTRDYRQDGMRIWLVSPDE
jgi:hypothetical protein